MPAGRSNGSADWGENRMNDATKLAASRAMAHLLAAAALLFAIEARQLGTGPAARRLGRFWLMLVPAAILVYVTMGIVWPWAVIDPANPLKAIAYFGHFFEKPWQELFAGRLYEPPAMPRSYVPVLLGLKLPEPIVISSPAMLDTLRGYIARR